MTGGRWEFHQDRGWVWTEPPADALAERIIQPANDPRPIGGDFREHRTKAGPLWVPAGARLHDVPFGFRPASAARQYAMPIAVDEPDPAKILGDCTGG